ncbi:hypothetical protein GX51_04083, partial [Blastomyces parvus]
ESEKTYNEELKKVIDLKFSESNTENLEILKEFKNLFEDNSEDTEFEESRTDLQNLSEHSVETDEYQKFSLYHEQTLDQELLEELQTLLDFLK